MIIQKEGLCGGQPCIKGHRITVELIKNFYYNEHQTIEDIMYCFPQLTKEEILEAINY